MKSESKPNLWFLKDKSFCQSYKIPQKVPDIVITSPDPLEKPVILKQITIESTITEDEQIDLTSPLIAGRNLILHW